MQEVAEEAEGEEEEEDEEEDIVLGSQDSPRSSESGSVGSLINFLTNSSD